MVKLLINEDPQLLCIDNNASESPLHVAVEKGNMNIIKEIMKRDCFSCKGPNGRTALHTAVIHKRRDIAKLLLEKNPELINEGDGNKRNPLHFASGLGLLSYVCMLMKCNSSKPCLLDNFGFAPIHMSAHFGELDIVKKFIKLQPDLKDLLDGRCKNILHIAVESQQVHVVKYILMEKKLNELLNGKDKDGNTPLHQAAITGNSYIVNLLVGHKRLDVMALNRKQQTAFDIARSQMEEENKEVDKDKSLVLMTLLHASSPPWSNHKTLQCEIVRLGNRDNRKSVESYKSQGNILLIIATLVATVTFAASFTPPGGYLSEGPYPHQGEAVLKDSLDFKLLLSSDTTGMYLSVGAILLLIWLQFTKQPRVARVILYLGQILIVISIASMVVTFLFATYLTSSESKNSSLSTFGYVISIFTWICSIVIVGALGALLRVFRFDYLLGNRRSIYLRSWIQECMRKHKNEVSILFHYN